MVEKGASSGAGGGEIPPASDEDAEESSQAQEGQDPSSRDAAASPLPPPVVSEATGTPANEEQETAQGEVLGTGTGEGEEQELLDIPPPVLPNVEELKRDFPNAPKAPWSPTVGAKDFKAEDLIAGQMEVSYGGQVRVQIWERLNRAKDGKFSLFPGNGKVGIWKLCWKGLIPNTP